MNNCAASYNFADAHRVNRELPALSDAERQERMEAVAALWREIGEREIARANTE